MSVGRGPFSAFPEYLQDHDARHGYSPDRRLKPGPTCSPFQDSLARMANCGTGQASTHRFHSQFPPTRRCNRNSVSRSDSDDHGQTGGIASKIRRTSVTDVPPCEALPAQTPRQIRGPRCSIFHSLCKKTEDHQNTMVDQTLARTPTC